MGDDEAPYPVVYVMLYVWYSVGWSLADGGPPSLWYLPWVGLALIATSWLWVWWLDFGDRTNPKRAIVFLAILGVLVGGNGAGALVVAFKRTDGFGWQGQPTPRDAIRAFTAESCLFRYPLYTKGGKTIEADCPSWGKQPGKSFHNYTTSDQPQEALDRWYTYKQRFRYLPELQWSKTEVERGDGTAIVHMPVELPYSAEGQDLSRIPPTDLWCLPDNRVETLDRTHGVCSGRRMESVACRRQ